MDSIRFQFDDDVMIMMMKIMMMTLMLIFALKTSFSSRFLRIACSSNLTKSPYPSKARGGDDDDNDADDDGDYGDNDDGGDDADDAGFHGDGDNIGVPVRSKTTLDLVFHRPLSLSFEECESLSFTNKTNCELLSYREL